ncbi:MAG: DUF512 domain-containing protein [Bacillota bacterium]
MSESGIKGMLLENAARSNILPVFSTCNVQCIFCSHRQNPPAVKVHRITPAGMEFVRDALSLMERGKPVVIGESVTTVIEGEPFLHPRIKDILGLIREKMSGTEIRITTNGNLLDREMVLFLASLGNVTVCLSLNSSDVRTRELLMRDARADIAVRAAALLSEHSVPYHGSMVAMPHITGWDDIAGTIKFFDAQGALTVRVFLPGHTRFAPHELVVPHDLREKLHLFLIGMRREVSVPITMEPPVISGLDAVVAGVIQGSPARRAGILPGDIIVRVDGRPAGSRVDAFMKILNSDNPSLDVQRGGLVENIALAKEKGHSSGLVFDYDIDPRMVKDIIRAVRRRGAGEAVLAASELGYDALRLGLEKFAPGDAGITPVKVKNRFFGGSIGCAGLLTVGDIRSCLAEYAGRADLFIIPGIMFDARGRDITGCSYLDLKKDNGPEVELI